LEIRPAGAPESVVDLLLRARRAAGAAGHQADERRAVDELLEIVDQTTQPLLAAELLVQHMYLGFGLGRQVSGLPDALAAERLAAPHPDSLEYARVESAVAYSMMWAGVEEGPARAGTALALAEAGGRPEAITHALIVVAMARCQAGDLRGAAGAARRALAVAAQIGQFKTAVEAGYWIANSTEGPTPQTFIANVGEARQELERAGAPHFFVSDMCSLEAEALLWVGDWRTCLDRLRVTLGARPSTLADARSRNTAALLASRQGRRAEAAAHFERAEELISVSSEFRAFPFDAVRAELAIAAGDTERAFESALHGLGLVPLPGDPEVLLPLAVRALADRVQACRDEGSDPVVELDRLRELRKRYPQVVTGEEQPAEFMRRWIVAMQDLTEAETARATRDPQEVARWHEAAEACQFATAPWHEAYCRWREAQAALRQRSGRRAATAALRRAYDVAIGLQAAPLLAELDLLARNVHLPPPAAEPALPDESVPGLTPREREVLAHIVAGLTYSEIARVLVLSEKTVSAHVSNMLRKTGTSSRTDLAELARRRAGARK
jgi:DNA-binding CsgD family transcriptional regulator